MGVHREALECTGGEWMEYQLPTETHEQVIDYASTNTNTKTTRLGVMVNNREIACLMDCQLSGLQRFCFLPVVTDQVTRARIGLGLGFLLP